MNAICIEMHGIQWIVATAFVFGEAKWLRSLRISGQALGSFGSLSLIHKSSSQGKNVPISVRQMGLHGFTMIYLYDTYMFTIVYLVSSKSVMALTWQVVEACQVAVCMTTDDRSSRTRTKGGFPRAPLTKDQLRESIMAKLEEYPWDPKTIASPCISRIIVDYSILYKLYSRFFF